MNETEKSAVPTEQPLHESTKRATAHKKTQNLFLANITHEFRTPIQTILATLDLLNETHLDGEQIEYTQQVHFAAETLLTLVNDFLDFSKLEMGQFSFEYIPFDPLSVAEQTVNLLAIEAYNKGIEIISDIDYALPKQIIGDPTRTRQILLNLIKNAVKFTPKGYVQVSVSADRDAKTLSFDVKDSGIGIPKEKQTKLFSDFYQTDASTTRKFGGTGLGLAISKNFVAQMGGSISMRDNPEGGSIFSFTLPYRVCDEDAKEPPLLLDASITKNTRILIVDDQTSACESLRKKLCILGFTDVETTLSGDEALAKMRDAVKNGTPFTHIFIDMIMPGMDGWRLSSEINQDTAINGAKLFLLIPEGQMGGDAKMKRLKWFNDYLYKPIKKPALVALLEDSALDTMELDSVSDEEFGSISKHHAKNAHTTVNGTVDASNGASIAPTVTSSNGASSTETVTSSNAETFAQTVNASNGAPHSATQEQSTAKAQFDRIAEGRTILVAEDHPVNQKLIKIFFQKFGAAVLCASNGQEAVELAKAHREIDLIFMDIQMPVMCGIEATRKIRAAHIDTPIIACTANTDEDDFKQYFKAGMNDTLIKPFKKQSVYDKVLLWLDNGGAQNIGDTKGIGGAGQNANKEGIAQNLDASTARDASFYRVPSNNIDASINRAASNPADASFYHDASNAAHERTYDASFDAHDITRGETDTANDARCGKNPAPTDESDVSSLVVPSAPEMQSCSMASFEEDAPWLLQNERFAKNGANIQAKARNAAPQNGLGKNRAAFVCDKSIWDFDDMLNTASGDVTLAKQLVTDFMKQTVTLLEKTALAVKQNRFADIQHCAHAIKGSSASLAVRKLSDTAKQLEIIAKAKSDIGCKACLKECDFCFDEFAKIAEDWLSQS